VPDAAAGSWNESLPAVLRDRYEVRARLGAGAFGLVLEARDRELDRKVAIKLSPTGLDPDLLARFEREARTLAQLEHPGVVRLFDHGVTSESQTFMVMESIDGKSLAEQPSADPLATMVDIAEALEALHGEGLVHRDVKPANILLDRHGRAVLVDLGLVRKKGVATLTATGQLVGTPAYMAPEAITGAEATPAVDWFAWGVTLYQQLEGDRPFEGEVIVGLASGLELPPPTFSKVDPSSPVAELLRRALAHDAGERPTSAQEVRRLLEPRPRPSFSSVSTTRRLPASSPAEPPPAPRPFPWKIPVVGLLLLVGVVATLRAPESLPRVPPSPSPSPSPVPTTSAEVLAPLVETRLARYPRGPEGVLLMRDHVYLDHMSLVIDRALRANYPAGEAHFRRALAAWLQDPGATPDEQLTLDVLRIVWLETVDREVLSLYQRFNIFFRGSASIGSIFTPKGMDDAEWARLPPPETLYERLQAEHVAWYEWSKDLAEGPPAMETIRRAVRRLVLTQTEEAGGVSDGTYADVPGQLARPVGDLSLTEFMDVLGTFDWMRRPPRGECGENLGQLRRLGEHLAGLRDVPADILFMARTLHAVLRFRNQLLCEDPDVEEEVTSVAEDIRALPPGWIVLSTTWCLAYITLSTRTEPIWPKITNELSEILRRAKEKLVPSG
jgi:serine/threonine protein kinase